MPQDPRTIVVDASVVLKWQLNDEECVKQATALRDDFYLRGDIVLIAPHLLIYEVANGIATATRHKRIVRDKAIEAMNNLMSLGVELREMESISILDLALKYHLAAYDAAYLALAESEDCGLLTGDKVFYQAMIGRSPRVKWIGDYSGTVN